MPVAKTEQIIDNFETKEKNKRKAQDSISTWQHDPLKNILGSFNNLFSLQTQIVPCSLRSEVVTSLQLQLCRNEGVCMYK